MSESVVQEIISKAVMDGSFRKKLLSDPKSALAGYELTDADHEMLKKLTTEKFAGGLGDRLTKGWLPGGT